MEVPAMREGRIITNPTTPANAPVSGATPASNVSRRTLLQFAAAAGTAAGVGLGLGQTPAEASSLQLPPLFLHGPARTKGALEIRYRNDASRPFTDPSATYRWLNAPSPQGPWAPLMGVATRNIGIPLSYGDTYLRAEVTVPGANPRLTPPILIEKAEGNPATDWFHSAKYGVSHHFLSNYINRVAADESEKWHAGESWDDFLATFAVRAYAASLAEAGVGFVILTLGQNSGYLLGPNRAYEKVAGVAPGERTPARRDLPMDIADALAEHGIKLILYIPANPPHTAHKSEGDYAITKAFGYTPGQDGVPSQATMTQWHAVLREYSERYGDKAAGWWIDGVFPGLQPAYADMTKTNNWSSFAAALKAGNPDRVITLNSGLGPSLHKPTSVYDDYTPGENRNLGAVPERGERWADEARSVQWFDFTYLGAFDPYWAGWGNRGTSKDTEELARWVASATALGGVIGMDTRVDRFGRIDAAQLAQLRRVREVVG
jgi:hypothetical protein